MLEDDPYGLVRYEGEALPSLFDLSGGEVIYSSSFSKTSRPGCASAGSCFPKPLAREVEATATATYITPVLLGQATVNEFVRRGSFEPNLERVRGLLGARRDAMLAALDRDLPVGQRRRGRTAATSSGSSSAASMPAELLVRAEEAGVTFVKGTDFGGAPDTHPPRLQLRLARRDSRRRRPARRGAARRRVVAVARHAAATRHARERHEPGLARGLEGARRRAEGRTGTLRGHRAEGVTAEVAIVAGRSVLSGHRGPFRGLSSGYGLGHATTAPEAPQRACLNGKRAFSGKFEPAENCCFLSR